MPRLHGYRERRETNYHCRVDLVKSREAGMVRVEMPQTQEETLVVAAIQATRADVIIHMRIGDKHCGDFTGPQLVGQGGESVILAMLEIANDAVKEAPERGPTRTKDAFEVIKEMLEKRNDMGRPGSLLRVLIVPVRQNWGFDVELCDGAPPGPVDIWFRCLMTRDIA